MAVSGLHFTLVDASSFASIPAPAQPGARCQTCDYWERLDGHREASESEAAADLKLSRLMAGARLAGAYGMLAWGVDDVGDRVAVGRIGDERLVRFDRDAGKRRRGHTEHERAAAGACRSGVDETAMQLCDASGGGNGCRTDRRAVGCR